MIIMSKLPRLCRELNALLCCFVGVFAPILLVVVVPLPKIHRQAHLFESVFKGRLLLHSILAFVAG